MLKVLKNKFLIILVAFAIWMLFFDANSLLIHQDLNKQRQLELDKIEHSKREKEKDDKEYQELKTELGLEKFAREQYYMKRENEDIYIIEYQDSIKAENKNE